MTIGFFLLTMFYTNMISTDLVVEHKPHVYGSYADLLNSKNQITPAFAKMLIGVEVFKEANVGTVQYDFWQKFQSRVTYVNPEMESYGKALLSGTRQFLKRVVPIITAIIAPGMRNLLCQLKAGYSPEWDDTYTWLAVDPNAVKIPVD
jgi:hypothetical protein